MLLQGRPAVNIYKQRYGNVDEIDKSILTCLRKGYLSYNTEDGKLYNTPKGDFLIMEPEGLA